MLNYYYLVVFSYSISIAAIIGLVRFKKMEPTYQPFVIYACVAFANEVISSILIEVQKNNILNGNIYVLIESLIISYVFYAWRSVKKTTLLMLLISLALLWFIENFILSTPFKINVIFRIVYSLIIVILSINQLTKTIVFDRTELLHNAKFIICSTFLLFYTFKATYEVFYAMPVQMTEKFYKKLFLILVFSNLVSNILYAIAVLWIPKKIKYTFTY